MYIRSLFRTVAALAILALPVAAIAAPDPNSGNPNYPNNNQCVQWNNNGQCVRWNNNGNWNNGNWNNGQWNNGRHHDRDRDRDRDGDRDDARCNNGNGNGYGYGRCGNQNRNGTLNAVVSSFSPYNLYLRNGTHVQLHDGTVINPRGVNLTAGQRVRIFGNWNGDGTFNANEIDVLGNNYGYGRY